MQQNMTEGKIVPILLKFIFPIFIGNVFQQLYNLADTLIVGRVLGPDALAAVGSTGTIMFLIFSFSTGLTTGFTVLTAQSFGAGNEKRVKHSVANAIILAIIITVIVTCVSVMVMHPLLHIMHTPAKIYDYAYVYIINIALGTFCGVFYNLGASFLRAVGNSRVPLYFLILSAGLNIALDVVLIVFLQMGTAGAAVATNISQGISALLCFIYIIKKVPELRPERDDWHLTGFDTRSQLGVGIPMALEFGITASGTMIMQTAINHFGKTAVAAFTAGAKVQNLFTQGMPAMGQTMATFGGQNYGSGKYDRLRDGLRISTIIMIFYSIIAGLLSVVLLEPTMHLFFTDVKVIPKLLPWASTYIKLCAVFFIPLSMIFIYRNMIQGCGFGLLPMIGGIIELIARATTANISMIIMSYPLAAFSDPSAWLATGIYSVVTWHFVYKKIAKERK